MVAKLRAKERRDAAAGRAGQNRLNRVFGGGGDRTSRTSTALTSNTAPAPGSAPAPASPAAIAAATDDGLTLPAALGDVAAGGHGSVNGSVNQSAPGRVAQGNDGTGGTGGDGDLTCEDKALLQVPAFLDDPTTNLAGANGENRDVGTNGDRGGVGECDGLGSTGSTEDGDDIEKLARQLLLITNDLLKKRKNEKQQHAEGTTGTG